MHENMSYGSLSVLLCSNSTQDASHKTRLVCTLSTELQGVFFSAYWRISAFFTRIFDPPEIRTNLER